MLSNRELVTRVCDQLHDGLLPVVEKAMREKLGVRSGDWVRPAHQSISRRGAQPPSGPDLQLLLKCIRHHWDAKFQHLGGAVRAQVALLLDTRNGIVAHYDRGSADVTMAEAIEAVTPAVRLLEAVGAPNAPVAARSMLELKRREARELLADDLVRPVTATPVSPAPAAAPVMPPPDVAAEPGRAGVQAQPAQVPGELPAHVPAPRSSAEGERSGRAAGRVGEAKPAGEPVPYPWKEPSNVAKDAKYGCRLDGRIKLQFDLGEGDETLLTTDEHPDLVAMVRMAKEAFAEPLGGVFYINEYGHVLVKAAGKTWYAGEYHRLLEFEFEGRLISPRAEPGAQAGDPWRGPHVGINYTLTADGRDVYFRRESRKGVTRKETLSSYADPSLVVSLARPVKQQGGRLYINEARVLFTPVTRGRAVTYVYLGTVPADSWFPEPRIAA